MKTDKRKSKKVPAVEPTQILVGHNRKIYARVKENKDKTGVPIGKFYDLAAEKELDSQPQNEKS